MKINSVYALTVVCSLFLFAGSANAQNVVKRIKCKDYPTNLQALELYKNDTGSTRIIRLQIVRDGCRPKLDGGWLTFRTSSLTGNTQSFRNLTRIGKHTAVYGRSILHEWTASVYFVPQGGANASGTFDYIFTVDQ